MQCLRNQAAESTVTIHDDIARWNVFPVSRAAHALVEASVSLDALDPLSPGASNMDLSTDPWPGRIWTSTFYATPTSSGHACEPSTFSETGHSLSEMTWTPTFYVKEQTSTTSWNFPNQTCSLRRPLLKLAVKWQHHGFPVDLHLIYLFPSIGHATLRPSCFHEPKRVTL